MRIWVGVVWDINVQVCLSEIDAHWCTFSDMNKSGQQEGC